MVYQFSTNGLKGGIFCLILLGVCYVKPVAASGSNQQPPGNDSVQEEPSTELPYEFEDQSRYSYSLPENDTGLSLTKPSNIESSVEYDPESQQYMIKEKIGDMNYRPTRSLDVDEYKDLRFQRSRQQFWQDKAQGKATTGDSELIPQIHVGSEIFNKIFGSNKIDIEPQGQAELIFGINYNRIENPSLQERLRTTTTFDFQEKIQMNVSGSIGDKVELGINYDTEATFDFENKTKLGYSGDEDEIIQEIDVGNISMPLENSLISGSQSLFGVKTRMKFGHLTVTSVFSQKKGKSKTITVEGGAQRKKFKIKADDYDENRHYFLSHYFKDQYNDNLKSLPIIRSNINITKIEVWVTNKTSQFKKSRDIIALTDLGENSKNISNSGIGKGSASNKTVPSNHVNNLYHEVVNTFGIRDTNQQPSNILSSSQANYLNSGQDYVVLENAKKLSSQEYTLHSQLGYISLKRSLSSDEILAVAFEYNYRGETYQVGDLSEDLKFSKKPLVVKLLKGTSVSPQLPTWELMMKNVYSLDAYQIEKKDFMFRVLYESDETGTPVNYIPEPGLSDSLLLKVMNLDNADSHLKPYSDGMFDFIKNVTILPSAGRVIFPVLEPFGDHLRRVIENKTQDPEVADKYVFDALYDSSKTVAEQAAEKNKFLMEGSYKSSTGSEIPLNAMNIPEGSVNVTAGGIQLKENVDYTVDYQLGRVKILNQGLLESGKPINISLESNQLYNMQTKTMIGTHLNYKFSDDFHIGGTLLNLTERPLTKKVDMGNAPISNTMYGFNGSYSTESQFLTSMVDNIPLIDAKKPSSFTVSGEFAHLIPGHSRAIDKEGVAYIDDFEASETSVDIKSYPAWVLSSTPQGTFPEADSVNSLAYNYNRAHLAWYVIDPLFLERDPATPDYMRDNPEYQCSHYVRQIYQSELFPKRETPSGQTGNIPVLNLAFYPSQKGPYNYDVDSTEVSDGMNQRGRLNNPESRWGGIMRELPTTDFEEANIQYIDFWLMDPFVENKDAEGGQLYFNLGEISEDILRDSRKMFEQGLSPFEDTSDVVYTAWGRIPDKQALTRSFENDPASREYQDVGLDGLDNEHEQSFFQSYLQDIADKYGEQSKAFKRAAGDPSNDDYTYYRSSEYDQQKATILQRYKQYNGMDGNSPAAEQVDESYATSGSNLPDVEDINNDNTLNKGQEAYYSYKLNITPDSLEVGKNFITDSIRTTSDAEVCEGSAVDWYHFRVPVRQYDKRVGPISDFRSIRFARMFLSGFADSVILRLATLDLVRSEWRKYKRPLIAPGDDLSVPEAPETTFSIGAVNIEENSNKDPVNYVLPPGITRVIDPADPQLRQLNEQSISLYTEDLQEGHARAAYKKADLDVREYKQMQMFVHAEEIPGKGDLEDEELTAFIRIGSDYTENYYEYEIPLKVTPPGDYENGNKDEPDRKEVWKNEIKINLDKLPDLKLERNAKMGKRGSPIDLNTEYSIYTDEEKITVRGNPTLSDIKTIMIGIRNPRNQNNSGRALSAEVWMNELRLTHFREEGGWGANARVNTSLSDFANVDLAGSTIKPGFGSIEQKLSERSKEDIYRADFSSNVSLGKFFPKESGVRIPMYIGYSTSITNPQYNPLDPDVKFKESLDNAKNDSARDALKNMVQDRTIRQSINFTNVGISNQSGQTHIYSPSNFSFNFGYSKEFSQDVNTDTLTEKRIKGAVNYNYGIQPNTVYPFRKVIKGDALRLIRDFNFNYMPSQISFRTNINTMYRKRRLRNLSYTGKSYQLPWTVEKNYLWTTDYKIKFDLTKSLKLNFNAGNRARIDNPSGNSLKRYEDPASEYESMGDEIMKNLFGDSEMLQYQHQLNASYAVPINKIQFLNWMSANINYKGSYSWTQGPDIDSDSVGNTINNSNNIKARANLRMNRLYNKSGFLKRLNQDRRRKKKEKETVTYEEEDVDMDGGESTTIRHKLGTEDVEVWVTDAEGNEVQGELEIAGNNRVKFTPENDHQNTEVRVEGKVIKQDPILVKVGKQLLKMAMGVKDVSVSYSRNRATTVPGYKPDTKLHQFGMNGISQGGNAPGVPFILGMTELRWPWKPMETESEWPRRAIHHNNNWLSKSPNVNDPIMFSNTERINLRSTVEPINGISINLNANRTKTLNMNKYFSVDSAGGTFPPRGEVPTTSRGNFSMSFIAIGTAFETVDESNNYQSKAFENLKQYRKDIAYRLAEKKQQEAESYDIHQAAVVSEGQDTINYPGYPYGYGPYAQQTLMPAFLAAYGIRSEDQVTTDFFPGMLKMLPNWRIRFKKLSEIDWIKERFQSVSLNHAYTSSYSMGSFVNNRGLDASALNLQGDFVPQYSVNGVSISEQFRPLIGLDVTLKNGLTLGFEWTKSRNLSLSFSNNRLTEVRSNEVSIRSSYRFDEVPLIFDFGGDNQKSFKSDLKLNADFGLRRNVNIFRDFTGEPAEVSRGDLVYTYKFSADYALSSNFNLRLFFDRQSTNPLTSRSYPRTNANFGFSVRFTLAQ